MNSFTKYSSQSRQNKFLISEKFFYKTFSKFLKLINYLFEVNVFT